MRLTSGATTPSYLPIRKCSSFFTWLLFVRRPFGGSALHLRIFGWDFYGHPAFGFR